MAAETKLALAREEERRRLKTIEAFKLVFGVSDATRTEVQQIVWRELALMGYENTPVFLPDKTGAFCPIRAAMTDGRRSLWADVKANVNFVHPQRADVKQQQNNR